MLERNVATILGFDHELPPKVPQVVRKPLPQASSVGARRGQLPLAVAALGVAGLAGALLVVGGRLMPASPPVPTRTPVALSAPPVVASVATGAMPETRAPDVARGKPTASATALAALDKPHHASSNKTSRSEALPAAAEKRPDMTTAAPGNVAGNTGPATGSDLTAMELADRTATQQAAPAAVLPTATPVVSAPSEDAAQTPPVKLRNEAIEAIRMLRRQ